MTTMETTSHPIGDARSPLWFGGRPSGWGDVVRGVRPGEGCSAASMIDAAGLAWTVGSPLIGDEGATALPSRPVESRIAFETTRRVRTISFEEAFELVERLRALEQNIGGAAMVVMAIREHASAGGDVSPIMLSPGQSEAIVAAVVRWSRESGDVPEDVDLLGQALVAELR